ncbi:hypothetical protein D3C71_25030 [compost metagenome]
MLEVVHVRSSANATSVMFADLVLDLLEYLGMLEPATFFLAWPFGNSMDKSWRPPAEQRLAVDGLLTLIRQTHLKGEDVYFRRLTTFVRGLPLNEEHRRCVAWLEERLAHQVLPTEAQVETDVSRDIAGNSSRCLSATPRYVAAMHLYGRLVHRKWGKRRHLGGLINAFGAEFVFEYTGKYAEHVAWNLVHLAVVWMHHCKGEVLTVHENVEMVHFTELTLAPLRQFLSEAAAPLNQGSDLKWSAPF